MSSVKIKKIKFFLKMPIVFFCRKISAYLGRVRILCAIYSFQFISIHFISILFYSAWRKKRNVTTDNEKNEILRKKRNITKKTKYYEILRNVTKKRKMLLNNHVIVIFYIKTVYFFIHLKNETIVFFLFFLLFRFFRFYSLFVNYDFFY